MSSQLVKIALWKCRPVETEENQKPGFPRFPPPLENAPRFPHSHSFDESYSYAQSQKKGPSLTRPHCLPSGSFLDENMLLLLHLPDL